MTKVNNKKHYHYNYPENIELSKELKQGDITTIARKTGYGVSHISRVFKGTRKMPDDVRQITEKIIKANREKDALVASL